MQGPALMTPDVAEEQLNDGDIAPILMLKLQSAEMPNVEEVLVASEKVKRLWSEWDRLEVIDGALYRRQEVTEPRSNPQLIVSEKLTERFIESVHTGMTRGHLGLRKTLDQVQ